MKQKDFVLICVFVLLGGVIAVMDSQHGKSRIARFV